MLSSPSLFDSLPIGQVFHAGSASEDVNRVARRFRRFSTDGATLLPDDAVLSNDPEASDGESDAFEVDRLKLHRVLRMVASLDFVLVFTPFDEANFSICNSIFDHLPRYKRPHVVMQVLDPRWDEALNELSPPPTQMVPSISVAHFLTSTLAPLGDEASDGAFFDMTSASAARGNSPDIHSGRTTVGHGKLSRLNTGKSDPAALSALSRTKRRDDSERDFSAYLRDTRRASVPPSFFVSARRESNTQPATPEPIVASTGAPVASIAPPAAAAARSDAAVTNMPQRGSSDAAEAARLSHADAPGGS